MAHQKSCLYLNIIFNVQDESEEEGEIVEEVIVEEEVREEHVESMEEDDNFQDTRKGRIIVVSLIYPWI